MSIVSLVIFGAAFTNILENRSARSPHVYIYSIITMAAQLPKGRPAGLPVDNLGKSYWLSEPSEILLGHRTTKDLPRVTDVLVIESGITDTFAAQFLKKESSPLKRGHA
ncbi:hypothetical protein THAR02_04119 [Trichoderma harzianum]|uniref:Uncharacterized protein n=1 Tax=Trichoderma harzianum TaxID=5544 RepID=A0A0G0AFK9_TRIHA|nr:hypothetical protein THAR02_04119 [Trichoderma harzianum]